MLGNGAGQTFAFYDRGQARLALVPLSLARQAERRQGRALPSVAVPPNLHAPIRQDVALLSAGTNKASAAAFLTFLNTIDARAILQDFGYEIANDR